MSSARAIPFPVDRGLKGLDVDPERAAKASQVASVKRQLLDLKRLLATGLEGIETRLDELEAEALIDDGEVETLAAGEVVSLKEAERITGVKVAAFRALRRDYPNLFGHAIGMIPCHQGMQVNITAFRKAQAAYLRREGGAL